MKKIRLLPFIIAVLIPLLVGIVSAMISSKGMAMYGTMSKPPLSPPAWVFPVAWTILYIMMGVASYFVFVSDADSKLKMMALLIYIIQLAMNFMWSIVFFNWKLYLVAFVWLIVMWGLVIICAFRFYGINKAAGYMMIPYIVWLTFAAYLNLGTYIIKLVE